MSEQKPKTHPESRNRPVAEFKAGTVRASVWQSERNRDGRTFDQFAIRINKRFYDRTAERWTDTENLFPEDLPALMLVVQKAYEFVALRSNVEGFDPQALEHAKGKSPAAS